MPGYYGVTLCNRVSNTGTQACCSKPATSLGSSYENIYIYVEEILPQCCFQMSETSASGYTSAFVVNTSPATLYFNPSCIIPGSFPIGRIDWDFGDNSDILTITRAPTTEYIHPDLVTFTADIYDPRNYIVDHTYTPSPVVGSPTTYSMNVSVFATNTNTHVTCNRNITFNPQPSASSLTPDGNPRHLIGSRLFDNDDSLLLTFEGEENQTTYVTILSATVN